jgi:acyl-coenzyme A thioesterase PaaI-like protein
VTFTVAEVLGGGMALASFDAHTHYPVVKRMETDFVAPGRSALTATARLDEAELARIRGEAQPGRKVAFELIAEVVGEDGDVVARTRGDYQLRPFG